MRDPDRRHPRRTRLKTLPMELGSLSRRVSPRHRIASRNDDEYLFSNPVNAERLRRAHADAVAGRNMIPFTVEQLRREFGLGEA